MTERGLCQYSRGTSGDTDRHQDKLVPKDDIEIQHQPKYHRGTRGNERERYQYNPQSGTETDRQDQQHNWNVYETRLNQLRSAQTNVQLRGRDKQTIKQFYISHELYMLHRSCQPIRRDSGMEPPPENIRRFHVLVNENDGILRAVEFNRLRWQIEARRAVIRCSQMHSYEYVEKISHLCSSIPDHPAAITHLDPDTAVSRWSAEAALRAARSVCEAVDKVVNGDHRNAFCAVRPPLGRHAGPRGILRCPNDTKGGSHGFCLLNNVAIGSAYARSVYRREGIRKIAIVDFDVHYGNGTERLFGN